jgi:hypothetical protein
VFPARWLACLSIAGASVACEPAPSRSLHVTARAAPARAPTFASQRSKSIYDQSVEGMHAIDALRGSTMTEALATDLGFKCADLKALAKSLETEADPLVWRLRTDIHKTCEFDVPVASALFELDRIQKRRAGDPSANVQGECRALKLAIDDVGTGYIANPTASDIIDKDLTYCGTADTVRRVP